jgi:hypothetical protein
VDYARHKIRTKEEKHDGYNVRDLVGSNRLLCGERLPIGRLVADLATMPQWAIHDIKSLRPLGKKVFRQYPGANYR